MRRFSYVEVAYFYRWWNEQTDEMKATFKELVSSGRLEFVSAGMCFFCSFFFSLRVSFHERKTSSRLVHE